MIYNLRSVQMYLFRYHGGSVEWQMAHQWIITFNNDCHNIVNNIHHFFYAHLVRFCCSRTSVQCHFARLYAERVILLSGQ